MNGKMNFGNIYSQLDKFRMKKKTGTISDKDIEELAVSLRKLESEYIPNLWKSIDPNNERGVDYEEEKKKYMSVEEWKSELQNTPISRIYGWVEEEDFEITFFKKEA